MKAVIFRKVQVFVLFIGYPRSGHSLVAALLDAHPEAVISMEWGALTHLGLGYGRLQLFSAIEKHARLFTSKLKNEWTGYSYRVEGLSQGTSGNIKVIGDKLAGRTSLILGERPELLDKLEQMVQADLKLIHVIRNPFDIIATMARRAIEKDPGHQVIPDLERFTALYFERVEVVNTLKKSGMFSIYDLYHEELIDNPDDVLSRLLNYLGLRPTGDYLARCAEIVFENPHKSREQFQWSPELLDEIHKKMMGYDFLKKYSFSK